MDEKSQLAQTIGIALDTTVAAEPSPGLDQGTREVHSERFQLGREIGRGGMGRVLEAVDQQFRRSVAVKEMLPGGTQAKRRFLTEALVTGNLEHPGIPAVYARGDRADGSAYYAMRLVSGRTFAQALDESTSLEERLALVPAVAKVAETVAYAHDRGVVHRDLKPENVLLGRHGEVFLLDWGIAKVRGLTSIDGLDGDAGAGTKTQVGTIMGSPMYMAPEQARGDTEAIDERTDVFALGALLYHVLTGRPPYQGRNLLELTQQAARCQPPAIAQLAPQVNAALADISARAMAPRPADRYGTAPEVAAALEAFQSLAARKAPSRLLQGFMGTALAVLGLMAALLFAVGLALSYKLFLVAAVFGLVAVVCTVISVVLAAVEYAARGQSRLLGPGLAVAVVTFAAGASQMLLGTVHTMHEMNRPELNRDAAKLIQVGAEGIAEVVYAPFASIPLGLAQLIAWAMVARRNALLAGAKHRQQ